MVCFLIKFLAGQDFIKEDENGKLYLDLEYLYSKLIPHKGGFSRNRIARFLAKNDDAAIIHPYYLEIMLTNLMLDRDLRGGNFLRKKSLLKIVDKLKELFLPIPSSKQGVLLTDLIRKFRDSVVPTDRIQLKGITPLDVPISMFSKVLFESHLTKSRASLETFRSESPVSFSRLFEVMWYSEKLAEDPKDLIEARSSHYLTINDESTIEEFKDYTLTEVRDYILEEVYPDANPDLLDICFDIMRFYSEHDQNKDALPLSEIDNRYNTDFITLYSQLKRENIPQKRTLTKWIKAIESAPYNKYRADLLNKIDLFKRNYKTHVAWATGRRSHYVHEAESIHYMRERLSADVATHECRIPDPKNPKKYSIIDLLIKRNLGGFRTIENKKVLDIPDKYEEISIDFTTLGLESIRQRFIYAKQYKNYQDDKRFLLIVVYNLEGAADVSRVEELNDDIKDNGDKNVRVITLDQYLDYIGMTQYMTPGELSNKYLASIRKADKLGIAATSRPADMDAFNELGDMKDIAKQSLDVLGLPRHYQDLNLLGQKILGLRPGNKLP